MRVSDAPSLVPDDALIGHNRAPISELFRDGHKDLIDEVEALAKRANDARDSLPEGSVSSDEERDAFVSIGIAAGKLGSKVDKARDKEVAPLREDINEWNALFGVDKNPAQGSLRYRCNAMKLFAQKVVGSYDELKREQARKAAAEEAERQKQIVEQKLKEAAESNHGVLADVAFREAEAAEHKAKHLEAQAHAAGSGPTRTEVGTVSQVKHWDFRIADASKIDLNGPLRAFISIDVIEKAIRQFVKANRDTVKLPGVEIFQSSNVQFRG